MEKGLTNHCQGAVLFTTAATKFSSNFETLATEKPDCLIA